MTVNGQPKTKADLPFTTDWITSGTALNYAYASPVAEYYPEGALISYKRYFWVSTAGLAQVSQESTLTVTSPGIITAAYSQQFTAIFDINVPGIKPDCSFQTAIVINGVNKTFSELPCVVWIADGDSLTYEFTAVVYGTSGTRYVWSRNFAAGVLGNRSATLTVNTGIRVSASYCGSLATAAPTAQQYSDGVTFNVQTIFCPIMPANVNFYIGTQDMGQAPMYNHELTYYGSLTAPLLETVSGQLAPGAKVVTAKLNNIDTPYNATALLIISKEDAVMSFDSADETKNPTIVKVASPGGNSGSFTFEVPITQADDGFPGDISLIKAENVTMTLSPVGPGAPVTQQASSISTVSGVRVALFTFTGVPVNTYEVTATLNNAYFAAASITNVLTVYDPSLGFTTGGGWFYWPGTANPETGYPGDKTNFGYTMQYGKNGANLKGNLLIIRHLSNGDLYRLKSNALDAGTLALGTTALPMGWASFSGKCNFTSIISGVAATTGNVPFRIYIEDRNEPGTLADRFWISVTGSPNLSLPGSGLGNAVCIKGGNIFAPHAAARTK